jgi:quercetin dioxygenase-like cupin family protein
MRESPLKTIKMEQKEFSKDKVFRFDDEVQYADGAIVSKNVLKRETGNISLFAFDKGEGLSEHTAPFDALVQVVDGKAEITIGGSKHFLEKGDSVIMPANIPHALKAVERYKMVLTMIKEPAK